MLIHSASQLLTLQGGPQRGDALGSLAIIEDGAVLVRDGKITEVGASNELRRLHLHETALDASGCVVMPGFVDPAHPCRLGRGPGCRVRDENGRRKIPRHPGRWRRDLIHGSPDARRPPLETLMDETRPRLARMFAHGTTTAEAKTGYGLESEAELRMLQTILALDAAGPLELAPTFLGAHAIPPEYKGRSAGLYRPAVRRDAAVHPPVVEQPAIDCCRPLPFVDVFCETGAFDLAQSRQILTKAKELGFPLKLHADEFDNLGGASLGCRTWRLYR